MPAAARLTDMHTCPDSTGPVPHVGGPIDGPGQPTVLIEGLPASVLGDAATCVGPPDAVAMGSATVLIGGQPAARMEMSPNTVAKLYRVRLPYCWVARSSDS